MISLTEKHLSNKYQRVCVRLLASLMLLAAWGGPASSAVIKQYASFSAWDKHVAQYDVEDWDFPVITADAALPFALALDGFELTIGPCHGAHSVGGGRMYGDLHSPDWQAGAGGCAYYAFEFYTPITALALNFTDIGDDCCGDDGILVTIAGETVPIPFGATFLALTSKTPFTSVVFSKENDGIVTNCNADPEDFCSDQEGRDFHYILDVAYGDQKVDEPAVLALLATGAVAGVVMRRRRAIQP